MHPFYEKREQKLDMYINNRLNFPEHLHKQAEILLVCENRIDVTVDGRCQTLSAGDCAVIFPGQIHSYHSHTDNKHYIFIFDPALSESYSHTIQKRIPECPFLSGTVLSEDVTLAFDRLLSIIRPKTTANKPLITKGQQTDFAKAWIHVLLANLLPLLKLEERKQPESLELTHRLVLYIMEHYKEPLSLESLAGTLHVNKYYLSHVFSEHFQMGFRQYINQLRLNHALHAIRTTNLPITQIWEEAGFNSQRSFNRFFLETIGMTPMEYRKACK